MAEAAVRFLLENVSQLLKSHVDPISSAENELQLLQKELGLLRAFLVEAGKREKEGGALREVEREIREVIYEVEDKIDEWLSQVATTKSKNIFRKVVVGIAHKKHNLAKDLKTLRESKLKPLFDKAVVDFANMETSGGSAKPTSWEPGKVQLIREDNVVGFEDEQEKIMGYLREETEELDVISIVGMPGLGKTTLARKIYHDKDIQYEFPTRIWVCVSQEYSLRDILLRILKGFTDVDMSSNTKQDLVNTVCNYLEQGKFLLVMDDVWKVETWNEIKEILPLKHQKSKVIITSRSKEVGNHASLLRKRHDLRFLTADESWDLLQCEVFGKLNICPLNLEDVGKLIAWQCDGLPLAIVAIGGVLEEYNSITNESAICKEWNKVSENVNSYVINNKDRRVLDIIALSYKNLSLELRNCFIYMGAFPEDYEIHAWTLTRLWIAEGFIWKKDDKSLEETAESNLNELINRNLLMLGKTSTWGGVKTCHVHDVIRMFCNVKAGIREQNLLKEFVLKDNVFDPSVLDLKLYRRLCVHSRIPAFLLQKDLFSPNVRSLICCNKGEVPLDPNVISTILEAFPLLRVLEIKSIKFSLFPPRISKLIHLRYITLSFEKLDVLPNSISELWNLQTLLVDTNSRTLDVQGNIWKLIQLRHLKTKAAILLSVQDERDHQLCENLQTLTRIDPECCTEEVLRRAHNVKSLGIRGKLSTLLDGKCSLQVLSHLENLKMLNDMLGEASENPMPSLPKSDFFPSKIKRLTLKATYLDWKHIKILGSMDSLQVLKLKDNAFSGRRWNADGHGFHALQFLLISNSELVFWSATDKDFPTLQCLVLKYCEDLDEIPKGILNGLQKLRMDCVGKYAIELAEKFRDEKESMHGQRGYRRNPFELKLGRGSK